MTDTTNDTRDDFVPLPPVAARPRIARNGVSRPGDGTLCAQIWAFCDQYAERTGYAPAASEVRDWGAGTLDPTTCTVQYYRWRKFRGVPRNARAAVPR